jgi:nitrogen fixation protein NifU and related proteins
MDLYAENILEHSKHPHGKTLLPSYSVEHEEVNLSCGDSVKIQLMTNGDRVTAVGWDGSGCAISQAAMSIISEELVGKTMTELEAMDTEAIRTVLGVPVSARRAKCAFLCLHALKNAIHMLRQEPAQNWVETLGKSL